ncbi:hypothetical protein PIB30_093832, partial [Stylosanthes scabra]|nr:hypothetical protein [Stylosanthes scabra]
VKLCDDCQLSDYTWPDPLDTKVVRLYVTRPLDTYAECTQVGKPYQITGESDNVGLRVVNRCMIPCLQHYSL